MIPFAFLIAAIGSIFLIVKSDIQSVDRRDDGDSRVPPFWATFTGSILILVPIGVVIVLLNIPFWCFLVVVAIYAVPAFRAAWKAQHGGF